MKIQVDMETFISYGGSNKFAANISEALFIASNRVKVTSLKKGSVIVNYSIYESSNDSLENLSKLLANYIEFGMLDVGGPISSYGKVGDWEVTPKAYVAVQTKVVTPNENGDSVTEAEKSKGNVGVIVGIVLSIIFCVCVLIVALLYLRKKKEVE
jgi:hypothetical protein